MSITCTHTGSMTKDYRQIVADALQSCISDDKLHTKDVRDRLLADGMKALVTESEHAFAVKDNTITWSRWNCDVDRLASSRCFTIFCLRYIPKPDGNNSPVMINDHAIFNLRSE